jgi:hypothetical protein
MVSLIPLRLSGGGNRGFVLLPFIVLIVSLMYKEITKSSFSNNLIKAFLYFMIILQIFLSVYWIQLKMIKSSQELASEWIIENISKNKTIGLENVPIYQNIPDILQKEFYFNQYNIKNDNKYLYEIVDSKTAKLPSVVVITNDDLENKLLIKSPKKDLVNRLKNEKYIKVKVFRQKTILNDIDYQLTGLLASPANISVFIKK